MSTCINCGTTFEAHERREGSPLRYKGHYCKTCENYRQEHGTLPDPKTL